MKQVIFILIGIVLSVNSIQAQVFDYVNSVTNTGDGTTTDNSQNWTDLTSITIDVTNISAVYLTAAINMRPDGSNTGGREAQYRIYRSDNVSDNSGVIARQVKANDEPTVESWGVASLVYIFDTSSLSGSKTFVIEHSNQGVSVTGRNIYSYARLTAIALTTQINNEEFSHDVKSISTGVTTNSGTFVPVSGLETSAITLPFSGDIYVSASINSRSNASSVAEYKLEYSSDGGANWLDIGRPILRSMVNQWDDAVISLIGMLQGQVAGSNYKFRVSHKLVSGTADIETFNTNIVAFALTHTGGNVLPSFYKQLNTPVTITGQGTPAMDVITDTFSSTPFLSGNKPKVFFDSQFLVEALGLNESGTPPQRMRARHQFEVTDGTTTFSSNEFLRYIPDNGHYGSSSITGLSDDLLASTSYTIKLKQDIAFVSEPDATPDEQLDSNEIILAGFLTFDVVNPTLSTKTLPLLTGVVANSVNKTLLINSTKALKAEVSIYTISGNLLKSFMMNFETFKSTELKNFADGIYIIKIKNSEGVFTKKIIL